MGKGFSLTAFAGHIGVARQALYDWMKAHGEFLDACNRARSARVNALEAKLLSARRGGEVAASIFALKNADPVEWREVRNVQHQVSLTASLTDQQLYAIAAGEHASAGETIEGEFTRKS